MTESGSWNHLRSIFDAASNLSGPERASFLDREVGEDRDLRQKLDALLQAHDVASDAFASREGISGDPGLTQMVSGETDPSESTSPTSGKMFGPYRILEQIGEGGFGVVYLAEQRTPFYRKVALKLLRADANSAQVLARFDAERQALALMDHPNIATVYDAGSTPSGQPYFVMELVPGAPITTFADEQKLTIDERLRLFLQLCDAIQHAHQKGVIHRDLKPSNVLVTAIDDKPHVKVIDFGVAKAMGARLTEETLHTRAGIVLGTPEYMSPEQAAGGSGGVDTRSDVYSLGVLLYELLSGEIPLGRKGLREAALEEMLRRIRTEEPFKLSTKLHSMGEAARDVAQRRRLDVASLSRRLGGDLEWITLKALEKEPVRRYATVAALAEDIVRSLSNLPISAHPPSAAYQLRKFAARRKGLVAFVGTVFVLAVGSAIAMSAMYAKQRTEALKAKRVSEFLAGMFASVDPVNARGEDVRVHDVLDRAAKSVGDELANEPEVLISIQEAIARTYWGLGLNKSGLALANSAYESALDRYGPRHAATTRCMALASDLLFRAGSRDSAITMMRSLVEIQRMESRGKGPEFASALGLLGSRLSENGGLEEGSRLQLEALQAYERSTGKHTADYAVALNNFAVNQLALGRYAEAESLHREALQVRIDVLGADHPYVMASMQGLGVVLRAQKKYNEAEEVTRRALTLGERILGNGHYDMGVIWASLGGVLSSQLRFDEADSCYQTAYRILRDSLGEEHAFTVRVLNSQGSLAVARGQYGAARPILLRALELGRKANGSRHPRVATTLQNLAFVDFATGRIQQAVDLQREAIAIQSDALREDHPDLVIARIQLASFLLEAGETREAKAVAEKCLAFRSSGGELDSVQTALAQHAVGSCLLLEGNAAAAESLLVASAPVIVGASTASRVQKQRALERAASVLERLGRPKEAAAFHTQLDSLNTK